MSEKSILISSAIFSILIGIAAFFLFRNHLPPQLQVLGSKAEPTKSVTKEKPVKCKNGDTSCISKNARNLTNQLKGINVNFSKHQCDGPRSCPTPAPKDVEEATKAIQTFAKDNKLQLIPVTGKTPSGKIYYCAQNKNCWSYDTKSKEVELVENGIKSPTKSPNEN